jgi:hypothetical protein
MPTPLLRSSLGIATVCLSLASAGAEPKAKPPAPVAEPHVAAAENGPQQYFFQFGLYRLNRPGEGDGVGIQHFPERDPLAGVAAPGIPHSFGALQCEQCHAQPWPQTAVGAFPRAAADRVIGEALTASVAQVIAEPVLSTVEGRPAHLRLQGGEVEYFHREEDGRFRLERIKDESGVEVQLRVAEARHENETLNVTVDPFEIRITTLDRREGVQGVGLAVGKPVFRTFEWDATLTCWPGQLNAFTLDSPRQGRILVVVRLELPGDGVEALRSSRTAAEPADVAAPATN